MRSVDTIEEVGALIDIAARLAMFAAAKAGTAAELADVFTAIEEQLMGRMIGSEHAGKIRDLIEEFRSGTRIMNEKIGPKADQNAAQHERN